MVPPSGRYRAIESFGPSFFESATDEQKDKVLGIIEQEMGNTHGRRSKGQNLNFAAFVLVLIFFSYLAWLVQDGASITEILKNVTLVGGGVGGGYGYAQFKQRRLED